MCPAPGIEGGGADQAPGDPHHAVQARRQLVRLSDDLQRGAKSLN